jgi:hypothetical protein
MLPPSPFTKAEGLASGLSAHDWRLLVTEREIRELLPGVYVDARLPDTLDLRIAAVAKVLPPDTVVARRTAAWVFGVDALDPRGYPATPLVELVVADPVRRPKHRLAQAHSADDLRADDVVEIGGVPVTSPLRTASDLGRFLPRPQALAAVDSLLHAGLVTQDQLRDEVGRWRRRRGVRQLEEMVALSDPATESPGESRMRLQVVDAGYRERRIGLEYDGEEFHGPSLAVAHTLGRLWNA